MILIVGLGNPGIKYQWSRHNIGFAIADMLLDNIGVFNSSFVRFNSELKKITFAGRQVLLAKPLAYMNNSGSSVSGICRHYGTDVESMLVLHDDIDIEFGEIKLKSGGGSGGHNGVESIINSLKTEAFDRLRFGAGRPAPGKDPADFVLSRFSKIEIKELNYLIRLSVDAIKDYIEHGISFAMNKYNSLKNPGSSA